MAHRVLPLLATLALVAAACGGDDARPPVADGGTGLAGEAAAVGLPAVERQLASAGVTAERVGSADRARAAIDVAVTSSAEYATEDGPRFSVVVVESADETEDAKRALAALATDLPGEHVVVSASTVAALVPDRPAMRDVIRALVDLPGGGRPL